MHHEATIQNEKPNQVSQKNGEHVTVKQTNWRADEQSTKPRPAKRVKLQIDTATHKRVSQYQLIDSTDDDMEGHNSIQLTPNPLLLLSLGKIAS